MGASEPYVCPARSILSLLDYTPRWTQPISGSFRGHTVWTIPAPASGAALLATLATLDCLGKGTPGGIDDLHHMSEALRVSCLSSFP